MPFVEVFTPPGQLRHEQRKQIEDRLVSEVMIGEGAPDTPAARAISWLVWHEPSSWIVGGRAVGADEAPTYVVRVTVPEASLTDEKRADIVRRVTQVLADADDDPARLFNSAGSFVLLTEIPEGNWGGAGRIFRFPDIARMIVEGIPEPART